MFGRVAYLAGAAVLALILSGCGYFGLFRFEQRAAWRDPAEAACMATGRFANNPFVQPVARIYGSGACGIAQPLKVSALADGRVRVSGVATLGCPQAAALEDWLTESVLPASLDWFGSPLVAITQWNDYSCRTVDNIPGANLSEHAFGNALDVAAFKLADGREIAVKSAWYRGTRDEQGFLREVEATACTYFNTVLAPGSDSYHTDHFHLDLSHRAGGATSKYCRPTPMVIPPRRTPIDGVAVGSISRH